MTLCMYIHDSYCWLYSYGIDIVGMNGTKYLVMVMVMMMMLDFESISLILSKVDLPRLVY